MAIGLSGRFVLLLWLTGMSEIWDLTSPFFDVLELHPLVPSLDYWEQLPRA
jgi:hypothetical protein